MPSGFAYLLELGKFADVFNGVMDLMASILKIQGGGSFSTEELAGFLHISSVIGNNCGNFRRTNLGHKLTTSEYKEVTNRSDLCEGLILANCTISA